MFSGPAVRVSLGEPVDRGNISMTSRAPRAALAAALLLAACRTVAPARPATADGPGGAAAVVYVPFSPKVLVVGRDEAALLLHAAIVRIRDVPSFEAAYLATTDVAGTQADDASRRAVDSAALLLETFSPLLPPDVRQADITAAYGVPGTMGLAISVHITREATGWGAWQVGRAQPMLVPPVPPQVERHPQEERAAVEAARTFLERTDERDGDAVWELASASVKASTSRRSFEEALWPEGWTPPRGPRRELFRQYEVHAADFVLGDVLLVCFASEAGIDEVQVRLDDDQEWRIADYARSVTADQHPATPPLSDVRASTSRADAGLAW